MFFLFFFFIVLDSEAGGEGGEEYSIDEYGDDDGDVSLSEVSESCNYHYRLKFKNKS